MNSLPLSTNSSKPTVVPSSINPSFPPMPSINRLADLFTLTSSAISSISIVFTMVLYLHYAHLHSIPNHIFIWCILSMDLLACVSYFVHIFFFYDDTQRLSYEHCESSGFIEQIYSFSEPCLMCVFWWLIYCHVHGIPHAFLCASGGPTIRRALQCVFGGDEDRPLWPIGCLGVVIIGVFSSCFPLYFEKFSGQSDQWCWVSEDWLWFRILFCWIWIAAAQCIMVAALVRPLCSEHLNQTQKSLLRRRGSIVVVWAVVNGANFGARLLKVEGMEVFQACVNPLSGFANVIAFLYSERMITFHALGLPPGADPPYGFTAAMKYIPERLREDVPMMPGPEWNNYQRVAGRL